MMRTFYLLTILITSLTVYGQSKIENPEIDVAFYNATKKWFSAWELVSKEIYHIDQVQPVDFIFFDDKFVYSTSSITIKRGKPVKGNNLINLQLKWKKALHNDSITLPDKSVVPVQLMSYASFAGELTDQKGKAFFVMPLPDWWKKQGVTSKGLGLENLVTGIFIHEFSHSQQMLNFGKKISEFEKKNTFDVEFNDDIIQNIFEKDTNYVKLYKQEVDIFYKSLQNENIDTHLVKSGLHLMKQRQTVFFKDEYLNFKEIEDLFLTMEGVGQFSMYLWLTHPKGGNISQSVATEGVRRGKKWWSQDEGFALFLILDKLSNSKSWAKKMFGNETESIINLINEEL